MQINPGYGKLYTYNFLCVGLGMIPMIFYKLDRPEILKQLGEFMANREQNIGERLIKIKRKFS